MTSQPRRHSLFSHNQAETSKAVDKALSKLSNLNVTNIQDSTKETNFTKYKEYESQLVKENADWQLLLRESNAMMAKHQTPQLQIDGSVNKSSEKYEYIQKAPCLQRFLRGHLEFRQAAHLFMEQETEIQELESRIHSTCQRHLIECQENKIADSLANKVPKQKT